MTLENYLLKHYRPSTTKAYHRDITHYLTKCSTAKTATYADVLNYLDSQRRHQSPASLHRILQSLKKYYYYLLATDQREDHPCESIKLRDYRRGDIQLQDLFSEEELEALLKVKSRYQLLANRNQLVRSLLIYQGLTTGELVRLKLENLDLEKGELYLPSSHRLNGRTLALRSNQILIAHRYIQEDRPRLLSSLKGSSKEMSSQLLITKKGTAEKGEGISYLVSRQQKQYGNRKLNPQTIRQSVIANLLKSGKDLRWVQVFAGHKHPSSTERYRQTNLGSLQTAIRKHHPLD